MALAQKSDPLLIPEWQSIRRTIDSVFMAGYALLAWRGALLYHHRPRSTSPYQLSVDKDYQIGYLLGGAYEIPNLGIRIAATYEIPARHKLQDNTGAPFEIKLPQSATFHGQTGIGPNTLLFGSARWREWTQFVVRPSDFRTFVPGVGATNRPIAQGTSDIWTYKWVLASVSMRTGAEPLNLGMKKITVILLVILLGRTDTSATDWRLPMKRQPQNHHRHPLHRERKRRY